jgi:hypothetical protein
MDSTAMAADEGRVRQRQNSKTAAERCLSETGVECGRLRQK